MVNLQTTYLGLQLKSPLIASSGPLTRDADDLRRLEDAGAGAVVLPSIFEATLKTSGPAACASLADRALTEGLERIGKAKAAVTLPVVASICGATRAGWVLYAREAERAGADAIECNLYQVPSELNVPGADLETIYVETFRAVKAAVRLPVAAKLTPFFTSMSNIATRFEIAGADGLVFFNRFYQPDVNLEELVVEPRVLLSSAQDLRLPLNWIGLLFGRVHLSLAGSGGVHNGGDVAKLLLVGADATMVCSSLLKEGIGHLRKVETDLRRWMERHEYATIGQMKGVLSQWRCPDPTAFERVQYMEAVRGEKNVVLTGREAWRLLSGE
jgi:dihydroorotate dehydrogenase (fumarate)